jgi:hypothetical protein
MSGETPRLFPKEMVDVLPSAGRQANVDSFFVAMLLHIQKAMHGDLPAPFRGKNKKPYFYSYPPQDMRIRIQR